MNTSTDTNSHYDGGTTMSEATIDDTTTETDATAVDTEAAEPQETAQDAPVAAEEGREAAKYRRKLREAESERDGLRGQLDALRRAEVDRHAAAAKLKPAALWASGADLAGLLAEDGTVDAVKVALAITTARDALGILPLPAAPSSTGQGNVGTAVWSAPEPAWEGAFAPRR